MFWNVWYRMRWFGWSSGSFWPCFFRDVIVTIGAQQEKFYFIHSPPFLSVHSVLQDSVSHILQYCIYHLILLSRQHCSFKWVTFIFHVLPSRMMPRISQIALFDNLAKLSVLSWLPQYWIRASRNSALFLSMHHFLRHLAKKFRHKCIETYWLLPNMMTDILVPCNVQLLGCFQT